ncbi:MAG: hypothetical protein ACRDL5_13055, partial [Solirubrobacteraceae bacterium]
MSDANRDDLRSAVRELLSELLVHTNGANGSHAGASGSAAIVPAVPAPPVAAVLRPSTWSTPLAPGEVIGDGTTVGGRPQPAPPQNARADSAHPQTAQPASTRSQTAPAQVAPPQGAVRVEMVALRTDEDLNRFVRALAARLDTPAEREAIRAGRVRFTL